mgnify:CR=1
MGEGDSADSSERRVWELPIVLSIAVLWLGIPALLSIGGWLAAFIAVETVTGIDLPTVTIGLVAAAGGPATVGGVSTLLAIIVGLGTWIVWVVRYARHSGTADAQAEVHDRDRQERRFEF